MSNSMRPLRFIVLCALCVTYASAAKKVISPTTTASNEQVDLEATLIMNPDEVAQKLGADPGKGIVLLQVKFTPRVDTPLAISPEDFILLAHNDGERSKPFDPAEIAGSGALVEHTKTAPGKKSSGMGGVGGLMVGGGGSGMSSPGNSLPVAVNTQMDDKKQGNDKLLQVLKQKELPARETTTPVEGLLYFPLDGKHKLKDMIVLYRGSAGKLDLEFVH